MAGYNRALSNYLKIMSGGGNSASLSNTGIDADSINDVGANYDDISFDDNVANGVALAEKTVNGDRATQDKNFIQKSFDASYETMNSIMKGIFDFADTIGDFGMGIFGSITGIDTSDAISYDWTTPAAMATTNLQQWWNPYVYSDNRWDLTKANENLQKATYDNWLSDDAQDTLTSVETGVGSFLPSIALAAVTGGASAAAGLSGSAATAVNVGVQATSGAIRGIGSGYQTLAAEGISQRDGGGLGYVFTKGAIEGTISGLSAGFGGVLANANNAVGAAADTIASKLTENVIARPIISAALQTLGQTATRMVETGIRTAAEPLLKQMYDDQAIYKAYGDDEKISDTLTNVFKSAMISGATSAIVGSVRNYNSATQRYSMYENAEKMSEITGTEKPGTPNAKKAKEIYKNYRDILRNYNKLVQLMKSQQQSEESAVTTKTPIEDGINWETLNAPISHEEFKSQADDIIANIKTATDSIQLAYDGINEPESITNNAPVTPIEASASTEDIINETVNWTMTSNEGRTAIEAKNIDGISEALNFASNTDKPISIETTQSNLNIIDSSLPDSLSIDTSNMTPEEIFNLNTTLTLGLAQGKTTMNDDGTVTIEYDNGVKATVKATEVTAEAIEEPIADTTEGTAEDTSVPKHNLFHNLKQKVVEKNPYQPDTAKYYEKAIENDLQAILSDDLNGKGKTSTVSFNARMRAITRNYLAAVILNDEQGIDTDARTIVETFLKKAKVDSAYLSEEYPVDIKTSGETAVNSTDNRTAIIEDMVSALDEYKKIVRSDPTFKTISKMSEKQVSELMRRNTQLLNAQRKLESKFNKVVKLNRVTRQGEKALKTLRNTLKTKNAKMSDKKLLGIPQAIVGKAAELKPYRSVTSTELIQVLGNMQYDDETFAYYDETGMFKSTLETLRGKLKDYIQYDDKGNMVTGEDGQIAYLRKNLSVDDADTVLFAVKQMNKFLSDKYQQEVKVRRETMKTATLQGLSLIQANKKSINAVSTKIDKELLGFSGPIGAFNKFFGAETQWMGTKFGEVMMQGPMADKNDQDIYVIRHGEQFQSKIVELGMKEVDLRKKIEIPWIEERGKDGLIPTMNEDGKPLSIETEQAMDIYCQYLSDNKDDLYKYGYKFADNKHNNKTSIVINDEVMQAIENSLSQEQKDLCEWTIAEYLPSISKDINEFYEHDVTGGRYYPKNREDIPLDANKKAGVQERSIGGHIMDERVTSVRPIKGMRLTDRMRTYNQHSAEVLHSSHVAQFNSFLKYTHIIDKDVPNKSFNAVMSDYEGGTDVVSLLHDRWNGITDRQNTFMSSLVSRAQVGRVLNPATYARVGMDPVNAVKYTGWGNFVKGTLRGLSMIFDKSGRQMVSEVYNDVKFFERMDKGNWRLVNNGIAGMNDKVISVLRKPLEVSSQLSIKGSLIPNFMYWVESKHQGDPAYAYGTANNIAETKELLATYAPYILSNSAPELLSRARSGEKGEIVRNVFALFHADAQRNQRNWTEVIAGTGKSKRIEASCNQSATKYANLADEYTGKANAEQAKIDELNARIAETGRTEYTADEEGAIRESTAKVNDYREQAQAYTNAATDATNRAQAESIYQKNTPVRLGRMVTMMAVAAGLDVLIGKANSAAKGKKDITEWDEEEAIDFGVDVALSWIPYVSTMADALRYNSDLTPMSMEAFNTAMDMVSDGVDLVQNGADSTKGNAMIWDGIKTLGNITGIPVKTFLDYVEGAAINFGGSSGYEMSAFLHGYNSTYLNSRAAERIEKGDTEGATEYIQASMSMFKSGKVDEKTTAELTRLKAQGFNALPKDYAKKNGDVRFSSGEVDKFRTIYSKSTQSVQNAVKLSSYASLDDETKAKVIKKIYDAYYDASMSSVTNEAPESRLAKLIQATDGDMDFTQAVIVAQSSKSMNGTEGATNIRRSSLSREEKLIALTLNNYTMSDDEKRNLYNYLVSIGVDSDTAANVSRWKN